VLTGLAETIKIQKLFFRKICYAAYLVLSSILENSTVFTLQLGILLANLLSLALNSLILL
jgi:hypothetical protein